MSGSSALSKYGSEAGYYVLNSLASEQAAMISYLDDFRFMMWITLAAIPLVFFLRKPDYQGGSGSAPQAAPVSE
jgi:DHA2 family multidrug resistance protein